MGPTHVAFIFLFSILYISFPLGPPTGLGPGASAPVSPCIKLALSTQRDHRAEFPNRQSADQIRHFLFYWTMVHLSHSTWETGAFHCSIDALVFNHNCGQAKLQNGFGHSLIYFPCRVSVGCFQLSGDIGLYSDRNHVSSAPVFCVFYSRMKIYTKTKLHETTLFYTLNPWKISFLRLPR